MILIYWDGTPVGVIQMDAADQEWAKIEPKIRALEKKLAEEQPADYNVSDLMDAIECELETACAALTGEYTMLP
jgi:hypothetical protein